MNPVAFSHKNEWWLGPFVGGKDIEHVKQMTRLG